MIRAFYIFHKAGNLIFHHYLAPRGESPDAKLISAFLGSINSWAQMYSNTGLSMFQTGSMRFIFERSIYSISLIFCISATNDVPVDVMKETIESVRETFIHHFWEDLNLLERGIIPDEKMENFKEIVDTFLKKKE
ncbi:MAG: hypothetical protein ACTSUE_07865 [Promethearchaeota archaeon]